ncbi:hypothetical protein [Actinomycetospora sp. NBRC 106375]|uniref:hypothetical protein n=1 Tax=Actinomycetospora sp. NBRC 106375 TaxID=3032207 RepID=UPI002553785D|nr:hypothetical protein [Actinomycetospora sp. NBRC 106375]
MHEVEVISVLNDRSAALLAAAADLDECDGYVVLVFDPETGELDAHGPYEGVEATLRAEEMRREFDDDGLRDVLIRVSRLHRPR